MPQPAFVHLRLHSEYSIVDGIVRLDEAIERAAADGMPALALTDLANVFGMVEVLPERPQARGQADHRLRRLARERGRPRQAASTAAARAVARRLSEALRAALRRAYLENQYRGRAELRKEWFAGRRHGGADRALRRASRRRRPGAARGQHARPRASSRPNGRSSFRAASTSSCSALATAQTERVPSRRSRVRLAGRARPAGGGDAPGAVREAGRLPGARSARVHRRRLRALRPAPAAHVHRGAVLQDAGRDGGGVRRPARGAREQRSKSPSAAISSSSSGKIRLPRFPTPPRRQARRVSALTQRGRWARASARAALSRRRAARAERRRATASGSSSR